MKKKRREEKGGERAKNRAEVRRTTIVSLSLPLSMTVAVSLPVAATHVVSLIPDSIVLLPVSPMALTSDTERERFEVRLPHTGN